MSADDHSKIVQSNQGEDTFLAWFDETSEVSNHPSNSVIEQQEPLPTAPPPLQLETSLKNNKGSIKVGIDTFSTLWRLRLVGREAITPLDKLRKGKLDYWETNGLIVKNTGTVLQSEPHLGKRFLAMIRGDIDLNQHSLWIEGRHYPNGQDIRDFLALPQHLIDWHNDAIDMLKRLQLNPMQGGAKPDDIYDFSDPWPTKPRIRRADLAIDFKLNQEDGKALLNALSRIPVATNFKVNTYRQKISGQSVVTSVTVRNTAGIVFRAYCKATETIEKREKRRKSSLPKEYGTWIRLEAQVKRRGNDTFTIPELCSNQKTATLWSSHLGSFLVQGKPLTHEEASQKVLTAFQAGNIKESTLNRLLGYITAHKLNAPLSTRTIKDRTTELATLGIGTLLHHPNDAIAYELITQGVQAWNSWEQLGTV